MEAEGAAIGILKGQLRPGVKLGLQKRHDMVLDSSVVSTVYTRPCEMVRQAGSTLTC